MSVRYKELREARVMSRSRPRGEEGGGVEGRSSSTMISGTAGRGTRSVVEDGNSKLNDVLILGGRLARRFRSSQALNFRR